MDICDACIRQFKWFIHAMDYCMDIPSLVLKEREIDGAAEEAERTLCNTDMYITIIINISFSYF